LHHKTKNNLSFQHSFAVNLASISDLLEGKLSNHLIFISAKEEDVFHLVKGVKKHSKTRNTVFFSEENFT
jgi:hypothetical protein